jgi:hypothetical protein
MKLQARCTRYNIMRSSLSVICGRSVVFFRYSGFLHLWVNEWLLFNKNKLRLIRCWWGPLCNHANKLSWIFIVLAHWNNSPRVDMSLHSDTLSWFRANQSLFLLFNTVYLVEKQQISELSVPIITKVVSSKSNKSQKLWVQSPIMVRYTRYNIMW